MQLSDELFIKLDKFMIIDENSSYMDCKSISLSTSNYFAIYEEIRFA